MSRITIIGGTSIASGSGISSVGAAAPSLELFPQGALADPSQWTAVFGSGILVAGGKMVFAASPNNSILGLTGSMLTTLNNNLVASTVYTVTVVISGWLAGQPRVMLLGGVDPAINVTGNGTFQASVTAGAGSNCRFRAAGACTFNIDSISVKL